MYRDGLPVTYPSSNRAWSNVRATLLIDANELTTTPG